MQTTIRWAESDNSENPSVLRVAKFIMLRIVGSAWNLRHFDVPHSTVKGTIEGKVERGRVRGIGSQIDVNVLATVDAANSGDLLARNGL